MIYFGVLFWAKVLDNALSTTKTISITAYPETKAESRLIRDYIADAISQHNFPMHRSVMPETRRRE